MAHQYTTPQGYMLHGQFHQQNSPMQMLDRGSGGSGPMNQNMVTPQMTNSGGSYFPQYYDEQPSSDSLDCPNTVEMYGYGGSGGYGPSYDISGYQDLEQIQRDLNEENKRIQFQEEKLKHMFDRMTIETKKLNKIKADIKNRHKMLEGFQMRLYQEKQEIEYMREATLKEVTKLKQEKAKLKQDQKGVEVLL